MTWVACENQHACLSGEVRNSHRLIWAFRNPYPEQRLLRVTLPDGRILVELVLQPSESLQFNAKPGRFTYNPLLDNDMKKWRGNAPLIGDVVAEVWQE